MSDHTLKRLTKKFFSPTRSANRLKTTDSEGRLGRKHERSECLTDCSHICELFVHVRIVRIFTNQFDMNMFFISHIFYIDLDLELVRTCTNKT